MSWSIMITGKAEAVKKALVVQFEQAKRSTISIPHEHTSVQLVEQIVNDQLDYLMASKNPRAVKVTASGSAYQNSTDSNTQIKLDVEPLYNFVE